LWDLTDPAFQSIVIHGHEGTINAIAIDPTVTTASDDATARLCTISDPSAEPTVLRPRRCRGIQPRWTADDRNGSRVQHVT
jgi:hypothetical protein